MALEPRDLTIEELESRMRPGALSVSGFLGPHERLEEVLAADERTLSRLGVSPEELGARLDALLTAAESERRRAATVDGRFRVSIDLHPGFQICPWAADPDAGQCTAGGGVRHASVDWTIRNLRTRETLRGPGLLAHLIAAHGFFEGREVPLRVEPEDLVRVLELR